MIARAPGKIVLSGAYAVLEGATALVAAVDRYAVADSSRSATFITPEVRAAIGDDPAPWFDASALRHHDRKLGLGSSAAILVASLGALRASSGQTLDDQALRELLDRAITAHRAAQGGGSGIDVAAAVYGGVIAVRRSEEALEIEPVVLPDVRFEVWACTTPASTAQLVGQVHAFRRADPKAYAGIMTPLRAAAEDARRAVGSGDGAALVVALGRQADLLDALGRASGAPIFIDSVRHLSERAREEHCVVLPAGAGGGDITLYAGQHPPSTRLATALAESHVRLDVQLGARGLHVTEHRIEPILTP